MRILMRNTVFKTAALAGLFLCVLMLAGAFSGITTSAHAVHADEVDTEEELKQFVKEAVDEYYIDFIIKTQCDFSKITPPGSSASLSDLIALRFPNFLELPADRIRPTIPLFSTLRLTREDMEKGCDFTQRFAEVFGRGEGDWNSGSIYLFVMDDTGKMLYHGADDTLEGQTIVAVDEGERNVRELIVGEAATPMNDGIVKYCWDDPQDDGDDIAEADNDPTVAPGDSLKVSYVIDPFQDMGAPALSGSPGIIFGSGIYPEMIDPELPECNGNGIAGDGPEPTEPMPPMEPPMDPEPEPTSVSGGGCAIAGGGDSTPRNDALNLLLMVSTLFLAVSFGNRAAGRRNAIRS